MYAATTFLIPFSSERLIIDFLAFSIVRFSSLYMKILCLHAMRCRVLSIMRRRNIKKGKSSSSSFRLFTSERHFYNFLLFFASLLFRRLFYTRKKGISIFNDLLLERALRDFYAIKIQVLITRRWHPYFLCLFLNPFIHIFNLSLIHSIKLLISSSYSLLSTQKNCLPCNVDDLYVTSGEQTTGKFRLRTQIKTEWRRIENGK